MQFTWTLLPLDVLSLTNPGMIADVEPMWKQLPHSKTPSHMSAETPEQVRLTSLLLSLPENGTAGPPGRAAACCFKIRWLVRSILRQGEVIGNPTSPNNPDIHLSVLLSCLRANAVSALSRERLLRIYGDCESVERALGRK